MERALLVCVRGGMLFVENALPVGSAVGWLVITALAFEAWEESALSL